MEQFESGNDLSDEEEIELLRSTLRECLDEESKYHSVKRLEKALAALDYDDYEGLEDVEDAIEDYRGIEQAGLSPEEYHDEKDTTFEAIGDAIDDVKIDEERDEGGVR